MINYPSLKGRSVIITGGARGLGLVMAQALLDQGARVLITAARSPDQLDAALKTAEARHPGACRGMLADVADWAQCQAVVAEAIKAFGRLDVVINNAARSTYEAAPVLGQPFHFWEADVEGHHRMVETNFYGPFLMARAAVPGLVAQGFGKVINISTSRMNMINASGSPYGPIKAGLEAMSVAWARDLKDTGVTVNVLLPGGPSDTQLILGDVGSRAIPGFRAGKGPRGMEGRVEGGLLPPEIMGPPAQWLCADESNAYTGRRVIARDWDPEAPIEEALAAAMPPVHQPPDVM